MEIPCVQNTVREHVLQTLAVGCWFIVFLIAPFISLFIGIYTVLFTTYSNIGILYLLWIIIDRHCAHKGGRRSEKMRSLRWWKYYQAYFPLSIHKTVDLAADRNYLFCAYPHGMVSCGPFGHFATNSTEFSSLFPNLTPYLLIINASFNVPFSRELNLAMGMCAASRDSLLHLLMDRSHPKCAVLMVGGAEEAYYCQPDTYRIILKKRKGFIRIALETGAPLVPVFSFGETNLYDQVRSPPGSWFHSLQDTVRKLIGLSPCIPIGRGLFNYNFGFVPRCHPVATVVGKPIEVPKITSPITDDIIDELHEKFTNALVELFEEHKHSFEKDPMNCKLIIE